MHVFMRTSGRRKRIKIHIFIKYFYFLAPVLFVRKGNGNGCLYEITRERL